MTQNKIESMVIRYGIVVFWGLFWLLNVVDKFIGEPIFLWVGKDRLAQFVTYFSSIGITNIQVAFGTLIVVTALEFIAFVLVAKAFVHLLQKKPKDARKSFFWGTFVGLVIFSFFAIGDQIFGDRVELLEHTIYWIALVVSWGAYIYFPKVDQK